MPPPTSTLLQLEDSEVAALTWTPTGWTLRLSAAQVQVGAPGRPAREAVHGHLSGVSLTLVAHTPEAVPPSTAPQSGRIREARLRWRASPEQDWTSLRTLPVPGEWVGECELSLQIGLNAPFTWRGTRLHIDVADDACFRESWAC